MADDVILNKAAVIERCLERVNEEYEKNADLAGDLTRQDSIVLNILRASEACIDLAMHVVRVERLGLPQSSREAFTLLESAGHIDADLSGRMKAMVGFRNVAVHDYQRLNLEIVVNIIERHLGDFGTFSSAMVRRETPGS